MVSLEREQDEAIMKLMSGSVAGDEELRRWQLKKLPPEAGCNNEHQQHTKDNSRRLNLAAV